MMIGVLYMLNKGDKYVVHGYLTCTCEDVVLKVKVC